MVLDIQATHLGQTFDYFVEEKYSAAAQPGVMVRVRFGGQRVNGIIWKRADTSATPESSIRYIERVVTDRVLVPESMRDDMTRIADAFGGTRANILRLAVPTRVAKVESQLRVGNRDAAGTAAGKQRLAAVDQEIYGQLQRQYGNINLLHGRAARQTFPIVRLRPATRCRPLAALRGMDGGRGARSEQAGGAGAADHAGDRRHD